MWVYALGCPHPRVAEHPLDDKDVRALPEEAARRYAGRHGLGSPLARILAPARRWALVSLVALLAAASTCFSLYLMSIGWAP